MSTSDAPVPGRLRQRTAEEIRVILARRRMSAAELARRTGLKQSTMARRMTGETAFDLDDLEVIARELGVTVTELLGPAGGTTGPQATQEKLTPTERRHTATERPSAGRPRDSRPNGRPGKSAPSSATRRPVLLRPPATEK